LKDKAKFKHMTRKNQMITQHQYLLPHSRLHFSKKKSKSMEIKNINMPEIKAIKNVKIKRYGYNPVGKIAEKAVTCRSVF